MSDCCGGSVVDTNYLCALMVSEPALPFAVGSKFLSTSAAGSCGISGNTRVQSRFRFTVATQAIASGTTGVAISWVIEDVDLLTLITPPGTTFTIPTGGGGMYEIEFGYTLASAPASTFINAAQVVIAGAAATAAFVARAYAQGNALRADQHVRVGPIPLAPADTIVCSAVQNTGSSINASSAYCNITWSGT